MISINFFEFVLDWLTNHSSFLCRLEEELRDEKDRAADMEHRLQGDIHDLQVNLSQDDVVSE